MTRNTLIAHLKRCFVYGKITPAYFIPLSFLYGLIFYGGYAWGVEILSSGEPYLFQSPHSFLKFLLFYLASLLGLPFLAIFFYLIFTLVMYICSAIGAGVPLSFVAYKIVEFVSEILLSEIFLLFALIIVLAFVYVRSRVLPLSFLAFSLLMFLGYLFNVEVIHTIQNFELDIHPS